MNVNGVCRSRDHFEISDTARVQDVKSQEGALVFEYEIMCLLISLRDNLYEIRCIIFCCSSA